jgi:hypothetical protein
MPQAKTGYRPERLPRKMKKTFKRTNLGEINYDNFPFFLIQQGFKVNKMGKWICWWHPETNVKISFMDGQGEIPPKQFALKMLKLLETHQKKLAKKRKKIY